MTQQKPLTLQELEPLRGVPREAIRSVNPEMLSDAARVIQLATETWEKPKPEVGFYTFTPTKTGEYMYWDQYRTQEDRPRVPLGRVGTAAQDLADEARLIPAADQTPVDLERLSLTLKRRAPKKRTRLSERQKQNRILKAIDEYRNDHDGICPFFREVADMSGVNERSVARIVRKLVAAGVLIDDGPRTLRRAQER